MAVFYDWHLHAFFLSIMVHFTCDVISISSKNTIFCFKEYIKMKVSLANINLKIHFSYGRHTLRTHLKFCRSFLIFGLKVEG